MKRAVVAAVAVIALVPVAVVVGWQVDVAVAGGRVQRGVELAGTPVGRSAADEVRDAVQAAAEELADASVTVQGEGRSVTATAAEFGWAVDVDATVDAVLAQRDRRSPPGLVAWLGGFFGAEGVDPVLTVDPAAVGDALDRLDTDDGATPVEPEVRLEDDRFVVVPGTAGQRLDRAAAADALASARYTRTAVTVTVPIETLPTATTDDEAQAVADALTEHTAAPLTVTVGAASTVVDPATLRSLVRPARSLDEVTVDGDGFAAALAAALPDPITPAVPNTIAVVDGVPVASGGLPGTRCCDAEAAAAAFRASLVAGAPREAIEVPPLLFEEGPPADLTTIGIVEEIGRFTTPHKCCEPRVTNIHRAADVLRGTIVGPGEIISLNGILGERTRDKGYVAAPAINAGVYRDEVGGGISQVATTLFNASFFAGFEFIEYQAHSEYISRYPYGREATVYWPVLDLKVRNVTTGSVLVWTEYTDREITIALYGTKAFTEVVQSNQTTTMSGACRVVTTERTRTLPSGEQLVDTVKARYRPGEGRFC